MVALALEVLGAACLVVGFALISIPVGLISAGALCILFGLAASRSDG